MADFLIGSDWQKGHLHSIVDSIIKKKWGALRKYKKNYNFSLIALALQAASKILSKTPQQVEKPTPNAFGHP